MALPPIKLLIIDDDTFILDMYLIKFREHGFVTETAKDGKSGLAKIKEFQPDVVLLDIVMPVMDGFDVLRQMKKEPMPRPPKVILLTNLGQKEDVDRGMELGADDYVIKAHYTPSEVVAKVNKVLEQ